MWSFKKRKEKKIEKKEEIKVVKLGETFHLKPGETASVEIPIPAEIIYDHIGESGNIGKLVARYEDKYGNKYESEAEVNIEDIKNKGVEKKIKSKTRIVYYGPLRKRIPMTVIPVLMVGIAGIIAYIFSGSVIPIISGLGLVAILETIMEIFYRRVNKRYNDANRIVIVKEK